ncbi:MAG: DUF6356 family protein [Pseudomonadota bacterium]
MSTTQTNPTRTSFLASFKAHPASVGENYFSHMLFAARFAGRLFALAVAALIHAIVPAWFETTASDQITAMAAEMVARKAG